jgi:hypothetical protein
MWSPNFQDEFILKMRKHTVRLPTMLNVKC